MTVDIELFGQLADGKQKRRDLILERPMTVQEVAQLLDLNTELIGLISIDGVQHELEDGVPTDCRLCFFPPLTGG